MMNKVCHVNHLDFVNFIFTDIIKIHIIYLFIKNNDELVDSIHLHIKELLVAF
jgi:hypothetical protein